MSTPIQVSGEARPAPAVAAAPTAPAAGPAPAAPPVSRAPAHMPQLDALRAFAVATVLIQHFVPGSHFETRIGQMGVRLFFVLSGFLITGILLRCRANAGGEARSGIFSLRQFYIRRALRIFPVFYFVLIVTAAVNIRPVRETLFWNATYLTNVLLARMGEPWGPIAHFWTLAVEEQFYLVWPWLIFFTPGRWLTRVVLMTIVAAPLFRLAGFLLGYNPWSYMILPLGCLDTLGIGALLAIASDRIVGGALMRRRLVLAGLWVGLPLLLVLQGVITAGIGGRAQVFADYVVKDCALALACVWLVAGAATGFPGWVGRVLEFRPLRYIGTISYGIYIYHMFMLIIIPHAFQWAGITTSDWRLTAAVQTAASVLVAAASWHLLEKPINDLKDRFAYTRR